MAITIKEIAQKAGVSRGTVDRALNGRGGVSPEVERRILDIANLYGYKPNKLAKALATKANPSKIGLISIENIFFDQVIEGVIRAEEEISDFGVTVCRRMIRGYDAKSQLEAINSMVYQEKVDALAISPVSDRQVIARLAELAAEGFPIVNVNMDVPFSKKLAYVGCDYFKSGRTAAGLMGLITGERAQVGIISGCGNVMGHTQRVEGFMSVVKNEYPDIQEVDIADSYDDEQRSYDAVEAMLRQHPQIDALCFTTGGAGGGLKAAEALRGKRLRIVAFDQTPITERYLMDGLIKAIVCQQPNEQGYQAIRLLFEYLMEGERPASQQVLTELTIKIKQSMESESRGGAR